MRYFLELSYNGAAYKGWQRQPSAPSVQQTIEEALSALCRVPVELRGCGRTDTGVHAAFYVAHFDVPEALTDETDFLYHANSMLPPYIALKRLWRVADDAHARFDARLREYQYHILPFKDPFRAGLTWQYTVPLDVEAMNSAAAYLLEVQDFTSFAKLGSDNRTNICHVSTAEWRRKSGSKNGGEKDGKIGSEKNGELIFTIRSDRFLRNMVRAIVGTLVDVGRGKITPERFREIVDSRDLSLSSGGAPACGLFLTGVEY